MTAEEYRFRALSNPTILAKMTCQQGEQLTYEQMVKRFEALWRKKQELKINTKRIPF